MKIHVPLGLTKKKENKKSVVYEIGNYIVTVRDAGYSAKTTANAPYIENDSEYGELEYHDLLILTNKITGKSRQKRVFQDHNDLLNQIEIDYNGSKSQFPWP